MLQSAHHLIKVAEPLVGARSGEHRLLAAVLQRVQDAVLRIAKDCPSILPEESRADRGRSFGLVIPHRRPRRILSRCRFCPPIQRRVEPILSFRDLRADLILI